MTADLTIQFLSGEADAMQRWDDFVDRCPTATFFHRTGWKRVLERSFGHPTYYIYAESEGIIRGVLPLAQINSRLFSNALISTPFCVYGGSVAICEKSHEALNRAACKLARELKVDYLELRNLQPRPSGHPKKELYVTFRKEIDADQDVNLKNIPRKQRAVVRKGIRSGLQCVVDTDLDRFYRIYAESVRNLGTPVFPRTFFQVLRDTFGPACEILTVEDQGEAISSVMSFYFRDQVLPYYGGGTRKARILKSNDFMYWNLMCRAARRGVRIFDFGRSKKGTGSYRFKTHWGFEPEPLHYEFDLVRSNRLPDINPMNPKYRMLIALWQRLPLRLSMFLGPWIAKDLG